MLPGPKKMALQQHGVSVGCQTVRRGPYELDTIELEAIRDGKEAVMERLRLEGVLQDNTPQPEINADLLERRFQRSRNVAGERVEYMLDDHGVSGDSLGRTNKQLSPLMQLQSARFMMRKQEERINELMRKGHVLPPGGVAPVLSQSVAPTGTADEVMLRGKLEDLRQQITRRDSEVEFMQKQIIELQTALASSRRDVKMTQTSCRVSQCLVSTCVHGLEGIESRTSIRNENLTEFVSIVRDALDLWVQEETESPVYALLAPAELKERIAFLYDRLQGVEGANEEDVDKGIVYTEKQLIAIFSEATTSVRGDEDPRLSGDFDSTSLHSHVIAFKSGMDCVLHDVTQCIGIIDGMFKRMELSRSDAPLPGDTPFMQVFRALKALAANIDPYIIATVAERLDGEKNLWNQEVVEINNRRATKETAVLAKCEAARDELMIALEPLKRRRMQCLFHRILTRVRLRRLQKDLVLPRWSAFALRRMYCVELVKAFVESNAIDNGIQNAVSKHWKEISAFVLPIYEKWASVPTMRKSRFTPGIIPQAPLHPHELWGVLDEQLSYRVSMVDSSANNLLAALDATQYCRDLFNKNLKFLKHDELTRLAEWKEIKSLRALRIPSAAGRGLGTPSRHNVPAPGVTPDPDTPYLPPKSKHHSVTWTSTSEGAFCDKPIYLSGRVGEEAVRKRSLRRSRVSSRALLLEEGEGKKDARKRSRVSRPFAPDDPADASAENDADENSSATTPPFTPAEVDGGPNDTEHTTTPAPLTVREEAIQALMGAGDETEIRELITGRPTNTHQGGGGGGGVPAEGYGDGGGGLCGVSFSPIPPREGEGGKGGGGRRGAGGGGGVGGGRAQKKRRPRGADVLQSQAVRHTPDMHISLEGTLPPIALCHNEDRCTQGASMTAHLIRVGKTKMRATK